MSRLLLLMASLLLILSVWAELDAGPGAETLGIFEVHGDVGTVLHPGSVDYDAGKQSFTVAGSGENMWLAADAFHFVWKKVSGDVSLAADVASATGQESPSKGRADDPTDTRRRFGVCRRGPARRRSGAIAVSG